MSDLAKFGRDALSFLNGDAIKAMADGEVGQFLILLARASGVASATGVANSTPVAPVASFRKVESRAVSRPTAIPLPSVTELAKRAVPHGPGNFSLIAARFRRAFGLTLSHGKLAKQSYMQNCQTFGEEFVLQEFEQWQKSNQWMRDKGYTNLYQFYESLASASEAVTLIRADAEQTAQKKEEIEFAKTDAIETGRAEALKQAIQRRNAKRAAVAVETPEQLFS